jgi:hypothetical protein
MASTIMKYSVLLVAAIAYLIYTIRYFLVLKKSIYFSKKIKILHLILIWAIPFLWIIFLKGLTEPTQGSYEFEDKKTPEPMTESGQGIWLGVSAPPDSDC